MKTVVWIVILSAATADLALASDIYTGNAYVVVEQTMLRISLHAFVLGLLLSVFVLYSPIKFVFGLLNFPARMQRFGIARKGRQASASLSSTGLACFGGRFEKAEQEAAKVSQNKEVGDDRTLALMLDARAANQMENFELHDRYLHEIEHLPQEQQLSHHLLLAESALGRRDYPTAAQNLEAAVEINGNLSRLVRLQLRYVFDHGDASDVLAKVEKLAEAGAINDYEAEQYRDWAYRRLLSEVTDAGHLKVCLKQIPESVRSGELRVAITEKYERLGLYTEAVRWVKTHYPQNRQPELLEAFAESVRFLSERGQQKVIDLADSWLQEQPNNALLLMYLGQLAYGRKLWGEAQGYLKASAALQPSVSAHLALTRVLDKTDQPQKAQEQRNLVLESVAEEEHPAALP